ncbi:MAG: LysM peptidoglycan-binding domain-containing protein [Alphaproteobacteria bacterium]|nr:LysM peptidoglycan-binding domain-containing protein [Alphaproteobacteria bacterium]MCB9928024.1 LysM peptidoglycan-binding domain-containing protein [Alphaproteobacteria bacterium]
MRVEVAAYVVVAMAVGAAATIGSWNPDWEFKNPELEARVVVGSDPPPGAEAALAQRAVRTPSAGVAAAPTWTVAVGKTTPSSGQGDDTATTLASGPSRPDAAPEPIPKPGGGDLAAGQADRNDARSHGRLGPAPADTTVAAAVPASARGPSAAVPASIPEAIRAAAAEPDPNRPQSGKLSVARVEYDDRGEVVLEGSATPGNSVRVRLNGVSMGRARADAEGHWRLQPDRPVAAGQYQLEAEEIDGNGKATAMVALPFAKAENTEDLPKPDSLVVQPGNSLWRLAERIYGDGFQYVRIFEANHGQIRDPDLIYPGQIFQIPSSPHQDER